MFITCDFTSTNVIFRWHSNKMCVNIIAPIIPKCRIDLSDSLKNFCSFKVGIYLLSTLRIPKMWENKVSEDSSCNYNQNKKKNKSMYIKNNNSWVDSSSEGGGYLVFNMHIALLLPLGWLYPEVETVYHDKQFYSDKPGGKGNCRKRRIIGGDSVDFLLKQKCYATSSASPWSQEIYRSSASTMRFFVDL